MAQSTEPPAPANPWKRYVVIALSVVVVGAFLVLVFWPDVQISLWIGELHSDDGRVRKDASAHLAASTREGIDDTLEGVLFDPEVSYYVRTQIGSILVQRNRLTLVENALRSDDLRVRTAALAVLHAQTSKLGPEWFTNEVVLQPEFRVKETVLAWLARSGDLSREKAIALVAALRLEEAVPLLRTLTQPERAGTLAAGERRILVGAARALLGFEDCETLPTYVERCRSADDEIVRLRLMQVLYEATVGRTATCKDTVSADAVKAIVLATLDDVATNPKHGALLILSKQPLWAAEVTPRLLAILDGTEGDTVQVRRAAMDALTKTGDETFARRLPRYFYDAASGIRSQAVSASREYARRPDFPIRYESCWAGLMRDETENKVAFDNAVGGLRDAAGVWIGVPAKVTEPEPRLPGRPAPPSAREKVQRFRTEMFEKGESAGQSRPEWARAWFDWWAHELGLSDEEALEAWQVRQQFGEARARGDVAAAKKILEDAPRRDEGLFTYEGGWLLTQE